MSTTSDLYDEMNDLNERKEMSEVGYDENDVEYDDLDPLDEADEARRVALVELFAIITPDTDLIEDSEFASYARDYAESLVGAEAEFLFPYVDWDEFAHGLSSDYSTVECDGTDYYYRA